jgi:hypothetical protein
MSGTWGPGVAPDGHRLAMLRDPPGDPLLEAHLQAIDDVRMRRLRCAQHEVVRLEH